MGQEASIAAPELLEKVKLTLGFRLAKHIFFKVLTDFFDQVDLSKSKAAMATAAVAVQTELFGEMVDVEVQVLEDDITVEGQDREVAEEVQVEDRQVAAAAGGKEGSLQRRIRRLESKKRKKQGAEVQDPPLKPFAPRSTC